MASKKTLDDLIKENETLNQHIKRMKFESNKQSKQLNAALDRIRTMENRMGYLERATNQLSNTLDRIMRYFR